MTLANTLINAAHRQRTEWTRNRLAPFVRQDLSKDEAEELKCLMRLMVSDFVDSRSKIERLAAELKLERFAHNAAQDAMREARTEVERLKASVANLDSLYVSTSTMLRECEVEVERLKAARAMERESAREELEHRAELVARYAADAERLKAELESREDYPPDLGVMLRSVADRQREACAVAVACEAEKCGCMDDVQQRIRATPLVTEVQP